MANHEQLRMPSKEYVFRERSDGSLSFVGDFEGLYQTDADPWGQNGSDAQINEYYTQSRKRIIEIARSISESSKILELGCGLGAVCQQLRTQASPRIIEGMDISMTAIEKAKYRYPDIALYIGDIGNLDLGERGKHELLLHRYDLVVMNQMLWYVLENLTPVLNNVYRLLNNNGLFLIVNAFMRTPQRYGSDIIDGFSGLIRFLTNTTNSGFNVIRSEFFCDRTLVYDDGLALMQKIRKW